jgi:hypothetical protein
MKWLPDWDDPAMNRKLADFCRHYGMTPMPYHSYTAQHRGKERGVPALAGKSSA